MKAFNTASGIATTLFILATLSLQAQHYWVGGTGNWSDPSHWATSSGGNTFHAAPPTFNDDVYFDANSFSGSGQTVTMDMAQGDCKNLDWTGVTNNPGFESFTPNILNIWGSLTLSPDMNCNLRFIEMESDAGVSTITTGGTDLGSNAILRIFGEGTFNLQDILRCRDLQMQAGTFNSNGNTIYAEPGMFQVSSNFNKNLNLDNSTVHCGQWRTYGDNNSFSMTNTVINTGSFYGDENGTGPYTYGTLVIDDGGLIEGSSNFDVIMLSTNQYEQAVRFESGSTTTCNSFMIEGSKYAPLELYASDEGMQATISQANGTVEGTYLILKDMNATGGATFNANPAEDRGNNTGWNITPVPSKDYYWVGNEGDFTDLSHWATTSGGSTKHVDMPSRYDNVFFDENSVTEPNITITIDTATSVNNIDCNGLRHYPTLYSAYEDPFSVYGSADFTDSMDHSFYNLNFRGNKDNNRVRLNPEARAQNLSFWGDAVWTLDHDVSCGNFSINRGTINTNDKMIVASLSFTQGNFSGVTMNLGASEIYCSRFRIQDRNTGFDAGTSRIHVTGDFEGAGKTFHTVFFGEEARVFESNTFDSLIVDPAASVVFEADSVQTATQAIVIAGTPSGPISLSSTEDGKQATLSLNNGVVDGTYLILKDMNATGGATFNATQSVDNGNNTGWNITEIVPLDFYWVGDGGNWSDHGNHWAKSSGGTNFYGFVPGPQDNVFFDENSFTQAGQIVTIDLETVNCHDITWSNISHAPRFDGNQEAINIYGSVMVDNGVIFDVRDIYLLSTGNETLDFGDASNPGTSAYMHFSGGGEWTLMDTTTCRELRLTGGTVNTNDNGVHVDFKTGFIGNDIKVMNLGKSNYYSRQWSFEGFGENLTVNATEATILCSSTFHAPPSANNELNLGHLRAVINNQDQLSFYGNITVDQLTLDAGKVISLSSFNTITANQIVAKGDENNFITLFASQEGSQAILSQASGTVEGDYLDLKDIGATGGATFNAHNSINNGNVSGWTFFGQAQTIDFGPIDDRLETAGPFSVMATASSGLDVTLEIIAGPATIDGNTITLEGAGPVQVKATQEGNINFNPAPSVIQTFCAIPLKPSITVDPDFMSRMQSSRTSGNQWFLDGDEIPGATGEFHVATEDGTYTVQIILGDCMSEMSDGVNITSTAVTDLVRSGDIAVYPNPVAEDLYVRFTGDFSGQFDYALYDINGQILESGRLESPGGEVVSLRMTDLPSGVYILSGRCESGIVKTRVVKR